MKLFIKILFIAVILALLFLFGFILFGDEMNQLFNQEKFSVWMQSARNLAWLAGIGLFISDLFLPIPATGIMAALGQVYGVWLGTVIATIGSAAAGYVGYGLAYLAGKTATRYLASDEELDRFRELFNSWGGAAIIISRCLPILPEVMTLLAGFARMSFKRFTAALLLGTLPTCFLYAYLGHISKAEPGVGMLIAILAPLFLWPIFLNLTARYRKTGEPTGS